MVCLAVGIGAAAECAARRPARPRMTSLMSDVHAFHFLRPWWLLALIPAWALFVWLGWRRRNTGSWAGIIAAELLASLRPSGRAHVCTPVTYAHIVCRLLPAIIQ